MTTRQGTYDKAAAKQFYARLVKTAAEEITPPGQPVDLGAAKRAVDLGVLEAAHQLVFTMFGASAIDADKAEALLKTIEDKRNKIVVEAARGHQADS